MCSVGNVMTRPRMPIMNEIQTVSWNLPALHKSVDAFTTQPVMRDNPMRFGNLVQRFNGRECAPDGIAETGSLDSVKKRGSSDMKQVVVIVDGFMTGNTIADEVRRRGLACINVMSSSTIPQILQKSLVPKKFIENHLYGGSIRDLADKLSGFRVVAVLPGAETAVELTEKLAFELAIPCNDPTTTHLRRNKYAMIESLRKAGFNTAKQCVAIDAAEIISWRNQQRLSWPVVVKPIDSAGTDSVTMCFSDRQIEEAVARIIGQVNILGKTNSCALAQSFLDGTEYVVNTLSWNGIHGVTDVWRYAKREVAGAGRIYDRDELISADGELQNALIDYVVRALDVLGVKYGPSHCEIMMTQRGPALVELGARVQGSINVQFMQRCIGSDQLNQAIDLYRERDGITGRFLCATKLKEQGMRVEMISEVDGILRDRASFVSAIEALPSYFSHYLNCQELQPIRRTVDLADTPGEVLLVHRNQEQLMHDYALLRSMEKRHIVPMR